MKKTTLSCHMEALDKRLAGWAAVRIGDHEVAHESPPSLVDICLSDGIPLLLALDLRITEKLVGFCVEVDRVVRDAMLAERGFKLRPDRVVTPCVFLRRTWFDLKEECFADGSGRLHLAEKYGFQNRNANNCIFIDLRMDFPMLCYRCLASPPLSMNDVLTCLNDSRNRSSPLRTHARSMAYSRNLPFKRSAKHGAALVTALMVIVVLSVAIIAFLSSINSLSIISRSQSNFVQAQLAARAGLAAGIGSLTRGISNDHYIVALNETNGQLFAGTGQAGANSFDYIPLFSSSANITNDFQVVPSTGLPSANVSNGTNLTFRIPGGLSVIASNIAWVPLTNSVGQTNARFAYWMEDLSGKLDLSVMGATGNNARRQSGANSQEIALWSLFNANSTSDINNPEVAALVAARSALFTPATARVISGNVTTNMLRDLASGLQHDTNEPQLIPFGFGYAQQGQPKMNLNANLSAAGATNIINHIQSNLPLFASTNRSGGMSNATYMNYLAANIVDYADADSTPSVVGGEAGNEPMPWLNEIWDHYQWQGWSGKPAVVTNSDGTKTINITVASYAEFWNMTDKAVTGNLSFAQDQTNRIVRMGNGSTGPAEQLTAIPWSFSTNDITFQPNEYKVLMVASNQISLNWGSDIIKALNSNPPSYIYIQANTNGNIAYELAWNGITIDAVTNSAAGLRRLSSSLRREGPYNQNNTWLGNSFISPNNIGIGLFGDPRINRYVSQSTNVPAPQSRLQGNVYANRDCTWGGRNTNGGGTFILELKNWLDGTYITNTPLGYKPADNSEIPTDPSISAGISSLYNSNAPVRFSNSGEFSNVCELGNIFDPVQWQINASSGVVHITSTSNASANAGGGQSLRIGRAEHPRFALTANATPQLTNGLRASQLLDIFEVGPGSSSGVSNVPAGRININTASTNVLRALAAGVFHSSDPALTPGGTNFVVPTNAVNAFISSVTNYRSRQPFLAPSQLTLLATNTNLSQWPTNAVFGSKTVTGVTEWSDAASEEWFSKIYPLSTIRSRNFLVYVVGQSITTNTPSRVEASATNVFQIYMEPIRNSGGVTTNSRPIIIRSWAL
jgi:hypothetical protein